MQRRSALRTKEVYGLCENKSRSLRQGRWEGDDMQVDR